MSDNKDVDKLVDYFAIDGEEKLRNDLVQILKAFDEAKANTFVHTTKIDHEQTVFYNNFLDYISGEEELRLVLVFDILGEKIIEYAFSYKQIDIIEQQN